MEGNLAIAVGESVLFVEEYVDGEGIEVIAFTVPQARDERGNFRCWRLGSARLPLLTDSRNSCEEPSRVVLTILMRYTEAEAFPGAQSAVRYGGDAKDVLEKLMRQTSMIYTFKTSWLIEVFTDHDGWSNLLVQVFECADQKRWKIRVWRETSVDLVEMNRDDEIRIDQTILVLDHELSERFSMQQYQSLEQIKAEIESKLSE